ncbi:M23 family metallopeptidase [Chryseobacterium echinoideorum]|uniref:M23 family metallopeptidase n=1 Tax=Chryseobacterium echinoideorum TaxID=1549648 RepID=UPI0011852DFF|nr:M23 family metallopeptidase [Chryseobacterium echinoideorum]
MKFKRKHFLTGFVLACHSLVFGQFNTLISKEIKLKAADNENQNFQKESAFKKEEVKEKTIKRLFNAPTKKDLKKEIDSLRSMMLNYKKSSLERNEASSGFPGKTYYEKLSNKRQVSVEKTFKKFDFINEEEFISKISMPLNRKIVVTSPFGWRAHPIFRATKMHNGADFKANYENVYTVLDGIVIESGWDSGGGGNYIKIKHSDSFVTSYLHLSEIYYKAGEFVKAGFIIAKSGNTGNSTGAHLHFSVTENGKYINPIHFLNDLIKANNLIANYYEKGRNSNHQH